MARRRRSSAVSSVSVSYTHLARQSGTYQGELILETETKGDINGDGKVTPVSYTHLAGDKVWVVIYQ